MEHAEWLFAQGGVTETGPLVAEAVEIFEHLRATPWLERAGPSRQRVSVPRDSLIAPPPSSWRRRVRDTMAIDERARHELFLRVERELGPDAAETLMELLPPVGWADVATKDDIRLVKDDLRQLEERMSLRFDALRSELGGNMHEMRAEFRQAMLEQTHTLFRNLVALCVSMVFAVGGLAFAAAKLT